MGDFIPAAVKRAAGIETLDALALARDVVLLLHGAQKICEKAIGGRFDAWIVFDKR
jgi:hypothetical protein